MCFSENHFVTVMMDKRHVKERALHWVSTDLQQRLWSERFLEHEKEHCCGEREDALERAEPSKEQCHDPADHAHCVVVL